MSVIIVGADYLGQIKDNLESSGITDILHISGRNVNDRRKMDIPKTASLIVVFVDYVNHTTAKKVKEAAKSKGIPLIFAKRSWSSLKNKLVDGGICN